jgi:CMP-N-acetylneuraminic acid synthetase
MSIYAMIPARKGSERLKNKNEALINGRPLVCFGIEIAQKAGCFDEIYVNSDISIFSQIAKEMGVNFYLRESSKANSETSSDVVVYDFFDKFPDAEILVWVNSVSPLQDPEDIRKALVHFQQEKIDSLITSFEFFRHGIYEARPINFNFEKPLARTQDLDPIEVLTYSFMIWRRAPFMKSYEETGSAIFCGKFSSYSVGFNSLLAIKSQEDLDLIRKII